VKIIFVEVSNEVGVKNFDTYFGVQPT